MEEDYLDRCLRWFWWSLAMIPFCYVVLMLRLGLDKAASKQPLWLPRGLCRLSGT